MPVLLGMALHMPDCYQFLTEGISEEVEVWQGYPYSVLWYAFFFVALQVSSLSPSSSIQPPRSTSTRYTSVTASCKPGCRPPRRRPEPPESFILPLPEVFLYIHHSLSRNLSGQPGQ